MDLNEDVKYIKGVGPNRVKLLNKIGIWTYRVWQIRPKIYIKMQWRAVWKETYSYRLARLTFMILKLWLICLYDNSDQ